MRKILNLVLSCDVPPYNSMVDTQCRTWDSVDVPGVETVFYFGESKGGKPPCLGELLYLPVKESLHTMGRKLILAFEWALQNKEFDFMNRPHSSVYVDKRALADAVADLPDRNLFAGLEVTASPKWCWGGCGFLLSRDVVQAVVDNKHLFRYDLMEDVALSYLIDQLGVPYAKARCASIDSIGEGRWRCMMYNGADTFEFTDWADIEKARGQYNFRVKQDGRRDLDEFIMGQLFSILK